MVEYLRLLNGDSLRELLAGGRGSPALAVGAVLVLLIVVGYFIVRRK